MKEVYELTEQGKIDLEQELEHLKTIDRPLNIEAIKEARAQGDLSENADYAAAREEQGRIEGRILEIENILKNAKIIEKDSSNKVSIGKTVTLTYQSLKLKREFEIVGTVESDPFSGRISNDSPLGKAIIGHKVGDHVTFRTESGKEQVVIIEEVK